MCVAEAAVLSAMRPTEVANYIIDIVENNALRTSFLAMKHQMAADGKVILRCIYSCSLVTTAERIPGN